MVCRHNIIKKQKGSVGGLPYVVGAWGAQPSRPPRSAAAGCAERLPLPRGSPWVVCLKFAPLGAHLLHFPSLFASVVARAERACWWGALLQRSAVRQSRENKFPLLAASLLNAEPLPSRAPSVSPVPTEAPPQSLLKKNKSLHHDRSLYTWREPSPCSAQKIKTLADAPVAPQKKCHACCFICFTFSSKIPIAAHFLQSARLKNTLRPLPGSCAHHPQTPSQSQSLFAGPQDPCSRPKIKFRDRATTARLK